MYYGQPRVRNEHLKAFPLPTDFFAPVQISDVRLEQLRAEADRALEQALSQLSVYQSNREGYLVNSAPWKLHADADGLKEFKRPHKSHPTATISHVVGRVEGNFREYLRFFKSTTRQEYFNVQKRLFNFTADANVLFNAPQSAHATKSPCAYEGIKWVGYEPFSMRFRMDSVHFESTGTAVDPQGRNFGYRIILPLELPEIPDLFKSKRSVRTFSKSVMLVMPLGQNENRSELFMTMTNDFKCNHVPRSFYKRYMANLLRVSLFMDQNRVASQSVLNENEWVPQSMRSDCNVCTRPFTMLRSKHHCHVCGEVVCRKCLVAHTDSSDLRNLLRGDKTKLCIPCMKILREDHLNQLETPAAANWRTKRFQSYSDIRYSETPTELGSNDFSSSYASTDDSSYYSRSYFDDATAVTGTIIETAELLETGQLIMTVDTSEMMPASVTPSNATPPQYRIGTSMMEDIDRSLQEQEALLRQLQFHARRQT
ncbi:hypothetical protein Poli38472_000054 [Pythium oligandrum]|uniref:FYVE-type domain-containing protein n=1 Tax=Pythium oligandrum TaxID=41045 RepID=A0A8K1CCW8_PYTOL|nr:hypothetical protein Poli38472_000054 [Pythium oligandrum]|eukprot:TMW60012.1 hypothetical protein Poli38472_000054 [Pythium oligandrum]